MENDKNVAKGESDYKDQIFVFQNGFTSGLLQD